MGGKEHALGLQFVMCYKLAKWQSWQSYGWITWCQSSFIKSFDFNILFMPSMMNKDKKWQIDYDLYWQKINKIEHVEKQLKSYLCLEKNRWCNMRQNYIQ